MKRGFTITEFMAIAAILGLLIGIIVPATIKARSSALQLKEQYESNITIIEVRVAGFKHKGRCNEQVIGKLEDGTYVFFNHHVDLDIGEQLTIEFDKDKLLEARISQGTFKPAVGNPE